MFDGLINNLFMGFFTIAGSIISSIASPFINNILLVIPNATDRFNDIQAFFLQAGTFVSCIYRWLLFTKPMFQVLFLYWGVKFTIFLVSTTISFIFKVKKIVLF